MSNYAFLKARLFNTPLMITDSKLNTILAALSDRIDIAPPEQGAFHDEGMSGHADFAILENGVAYIPVFGSLVHRAMGMDALSGLTSYQALEAQITAAVESDQVRSILLDVDSPGGEVNGVFDLVDQIYEARREKPITALVNEVAYSAGYAIASAADQIIVPRTGGVGSIGVIATHVDQSTMNEKEGLTVTHVYAGAHKADLSPHSPLSDDALARLQAEVDKTYELFIETAARNRGMTTQAIRETEAGMFTGADGVKAGLADSVGRASSTIQNLISNQKRRPYMATSQRTKQKAGENLARVLNDAIDDQATEETPRSEIIDDMANEAGIEPSTVNQILNAEINCPPFDRLEGFARALDGVSADDLRSAAEEDGCTYGDDEDGQEAATKGGKQKAAGCGCKQIEASYAQDVINMCADAGVAKKASEYIAEGLSIEQVREKVEASSKIRTLCTAAGVPDKAEPYIQGGNTVEQVRAELFDMLTEKGNQQAELDNKVTPHTGDNASVDNSGKPKADINPLDIYNERRKKAES